MAFFTSTYVNKLDRKGRVSVPAPFRAALAVGGHNHFYVAPNPVMTCFDGQGEGWMEQLLARIDALEPYSEECIRLQTLVFSLSTRMQPDSEGRISLTRDMLDQIGAEDQVAFVGRGRNFQIWEPQAFDAHCVEARAAAREHGVHLRPNGGAS